VAKKKKYNSKNNYAFCLAVVTMIHKYICLSFFVYAHCLFRKTKQRIVLLRKRCEEIIVQY